MKNRVSRAEWVELGMGLSTRGRVTLIRAPSASVTVTSAFSVENVVPAASCSGNVELSLPKHSISNPKLLVVVHILLTGIVISWPKYTTAHHDRYAPLPPSRTTQRTPRYKVRSALPFPYPVHGMGANHWTTRARSSPFMLPTPPRSA